MSTSLEIRNGDLGLEGNRIATVSGSQKLEQDLRCAILTPYGFYEVWPEFGSTLDSANADSIIGMSNWDEASMEVQAEINRICAAYQVQQVHRNQRDAAQFGRQTISPNETLLKVEQITMIRSEDYLLVNVELEVGEGTIKIALPLSNT